MKLHIFPPPVFSPAYMVYRHKSSLLSGPTVEITSSLTSLTTQILKVVFFFRINPRKYLSTSKALNKTTTLQKTPTPLSMNAHLFQKKS
jgi:hypothetical protein